MDGAATPAASVPATPDVRPPIKPNFRCRRHSERCGEDDFDTPAHPSLVPTLKRGDYYSSPSIEAMSKMSEAKLSQIDNLEIGRYGCGSVRWPGLTDVRRLDFDAIVVIDRGSLTLYADRDVPRVGEELNKEAVVTLQVRPSRGDGKLKSADMLKARLAKISEEFGGSFISYDLDKWIFRLPHFNGLGGNAGKPVPAA
eukprot:SRR837773.12021.p1 GENE.SRR837773.12021~~SRR837773.12021.p1  ORF type:complete len:216 (+),score=11.41 SRR837773.12021:57-650(+)